MSSQQILYKRMFQKNRLLIYISEKQKYLFRLFNSLAVALAPTSPTETVTISLIKSNNLFHFYTPFLKPAVNSHNKVFLHNGSLLLKRPATRNIYDQQSMRWDNGLLCSTDNSNKNFNKSSISETPSQIRNN